MYVYIYVYLYTQVPSSSSPSFALPPISCRDRQKIGGSQRSRRRAPRHAFVSRPGSVPFVPRPRLTVPLLRAPASRYPRLPPQDPGTFVSRPGSVPFVPRPSLTVPLPPASPRHPPPQPHGGPPPTPGPGSGLGWSGSGPVWVWSRSSPSVKFVARSLPTSRSLNQHGAVFPSFWL